MAKFGSLWIGNPLSKIEILCLSSFIYHGHTFNLYVYDLDLKVPNGVIKKDARDIIDESKIFKTDNSYGPFADMFRYKMIQQTGLIWTDTDNICLKNKWKFKEYIFGMQGGPHKIVANGLLGAPKDSEFISELVEISELFNKKKITWGEIGPQLVTEKIYKYNLQKYIQEPNVFYPINYWEWKDVFDPAMRNSVIGRSSNSHTLQIWNQMLNREGTNKEYLPKKSAIEYYYKLYVGEK
jgi:hypothetical protein